MYLHEVMEPNDVLMLGLEGKMALEWIVRAGLVGILLVLCFIADRSINK